jgi:protein TonB
MMSTSTLAYPATFPPNLLPGNHRQWAFKAAILVSVGIHAVALGWLPGLKDPISALTRPIQVRLAPSTVETEPVAVAPAPTFAPAPRATRGDAIAAAPQAQPIFASPAADTAPEQYVIRSNEPQVAAPVPPARPNPVAAPVRSSVVDPGMLAAYGRELAGAVATRQRYPRIALLRQWQGTAVLQLELAADGQLLGVRVLSSSGHETLDRQALEMVHQAVPLPQLPGALAGRPLTVDVPVVFRITS